MQGDIAHIKNRSVSTDRSRIPSTRPSTNRNISHFTNAVSPSRFETSPQTFYTLTQETAQPTLSIINPSKTFTDFSKTARYKLNPGAQVLTTHGQDEPGLSLSLALLEAKDEYGNPLISPSKKLNTNRFQTFLTKYKQDGEVIEKKACHLKNLEVELDQSKIKPVSIRTIGQSLIEKIQKKVQKTYMKKTLETNASESSPTREFKPSLVIPVRGKTPVIGHLRAKSLHMGSRSPKTQQNIEGIFLTRPKMCTFKGTGSGYESTNSNEDFVVEKVPRFMSKSPLSRDGISREEDQVISKYAYTKRAKTQPRPRVFTISLNNNQMSPNVSQKEKLFIGSEKGKPVHSKQGCGENRTGIDGGIFISDLKARKTFDFRTLRDWFEVLTVKGSTVSTTPDMMARTTKNGQEYLTKKDLHSLINRKRTNKSRNKGERQDDEGGQKNQIGREKVIRKGKAAWLFAEDTAKIGIEGWDISFDNADNVGHGGNEKEL